MKGISTTQVYGKCTIAVICEFINPLNAKLHPICHLLVLFGAHHILHVSSIRVNVDVKLNGCGKTSKHCWFAHNLKVNILNANNTTKEFYISHK